MKNTSSNTSKITQKNSTTRAQRAPARSAKTIKRLSYKRLVPPMIGIVLLLAGLLYVQSDTPITEIDAPLSAEQIIEKSGFEQRYFTIDPNYYSSDAPIVTIDGQTVSLGRSGFRMIGRYGTSNSPKTTDEANYDALVTMIDTLAREGFALSYIPGEYDTNTVYDFLFTMIKPGVQACGFSVSINTDQVGSQLVTTCSELDNGRVDEYVAKDSAIRAALPAGLLADDKLLIFGPEAVHADSYENSSVRFATRTPHGDGTYTLDIDVNYIQHWLYRAIPDGEWIYQGDIARKPCSLLANDTVAQIAFQNVKCRFAEPRSDPVLPGEDYNDYLERTRTIETYGEHYGL